ncbi:hypothetical protein HN587_08025 [Candidatus Woesearchaeota archaeon]|nr:hypothetical protein [Candidatus Woesearchaeota archaeon]
MKQTIFFVTMLILLLFVVGCVSVQTEETIVEEVSLETGEVLDEETTVVDESLDETQTISEEEQLLDEVEKLEQMAEDLEALSDDSKSDDLLDGSDETEDVLDEVNNESDLNLTADSDIAIENVAMILIKNFKAYPAELKVKVGTTVVWQNKNDYFNHIIGWKGVKSEPLAKGDQWSYTFTEPGKITWFSTAKPSVQGKVIIE